jgi:hypothetical protein
VYGRCLRGFERRPWFKDAFYEIRFVIFISHSELQQKYDLYSLDWLSLRVLSLPLEFSRLDANHLLKESVFCFVRLNLALHMFHEFNKPWVILKGKRYYMIRMLAVNFDTFLNHQHNHIEKHINAMAVGPDCQG